MISCRQSEEKNKDEKLVDGKAKLFVPPHPLAKFRQKQ
jgi:hypothetical protein